MANTLLKPSKIGNGGRKTRKYATAAPAPRTRSRRRTGSNKYKSMALELAKAGLAANAKGGAGKYEPPNE